MAPSFARSRDIWWAYIPIKSVGGRRPFPFLQRGRLSPNIRTQLLLREKLKASQHHSKRFAQARPHLCFIGKSYPSSVVFMRSHADLGLLKDVAF